MDPVTAGYFVMAGISLTANLRGSKNQAKIEAANNKLQVEQARLQAAEQAYERTKSFRQNIATNLALSGIGKGGVSGFRNVASMSIADYFDDASALQRQDSFAQVSGQATKAAIKSNKLLRDVSSLESAASLASKLGIFKGTGK